MCAQVLSEKRIGLVAHFYMDPQVQGVLSAAAERWPHIHISDSLVMADSAVRMAEAGCTSVAVLGVDFMSENVRAILDEAGHADVAVSRCLHAPSVRTSVGRACCLQVAMALIGPALWGSSLWASIKHVYSTNIARWHSTTVERSFCMESVGFHVCACPVRADLLQECTAWT